MPCHQINLMSVELKIADRELFLRAVKALGLRFTEASTGRVFIEGRIDINFQKQTVNFPDFMADRVNKIKREYSKEVIKNVAKKKRWKLKFTKGTKQGVLMR